MSDAAQTGYAHGLDRALDQLASIVEDDPALRAAEESPRDRAIALYAQMVGALMLSRAVLSADRALANEIIVAARNDLLRAVGEEPEGAAAVGDKPDRRRGRPH